METIRKYAYLSYNVIGYVHIIYTPDGCISKSAGSCDEYCNPMCYYCDGVEYLGGLEELDSILKNHIVDELVVTRPLSYNKNLEKALQEMQNRGITITMLLNRTNINSANAIVTMIEDIPALKFHTVSLHEGQLRAKRMLDIVGSLFGMLLFLLAGVVFAPLIKLESKGPVIFKQDRVGKNGRIFKMWKFRSMLDGADAMKKALEKHNEMKGHMFKMEKDPRVTRVGKIMRKTYIDELPQFINVLTGDMSLVGTRPPTVDEVMEYQAHHYKRISVIPGITGLWQVSGGNSINDFEEVVRLDDQYITEWSIWNDIRIVFKTLILGFASILNIARSIPQKTKIATVEETYLEHESIARYENAEGQIWAQQLLTQNEEMTEHTFEIAGSKRHQL